MTKRTRRSTMIYGIVWYSMAWFGLLVLCKYTTMQNFGLLGLTSVKLHLLSAMSTFYLNIFT